ncbi:HypC/HybG/HupF family hydrogenase formation chaperone [Candidatus Woesearchaeota archaeon]|nr:HypC/HybG/HupF family hydrogenase formation chaperone [Candidatus Woesearchaeota archaeon]HIH37713.1 HypC/HybG/HupF family hydrogenase formation chaperone [Candidatus Woesearchaeota archaeon]HIH48250.1 HypC/HybG/HupF family hydrogenase formation chaperone [Candidatus Woesearchaeota archaeon]HIJ03266.1 HypC/HybG/HupF family hydrogenase formation chaperone [Candidatus Woesearchaeota archaeon]
MQEEQYFLKYAWPCTWVKKERGGISEDEFEMLKNAAEKGVRVPRATLERVYDVACKHMRRVAKEMRKDMWSIAVIDRYFLEEHNRMIDENEDFAMKLTPSLKKLCKCSKAKVLGVIDEFLKVEVGRDIRTVSAVFVPDAKPGDTVIVHYGYAVKMITS